MGIGRRGPAVGGTSRLTLVALISLMLALAMLSAGASPASAAADWESSTEPVSLSTSGDKGNGDSYSVDIAGDARAVTFVSAASNLVPGVSGRQVYARDLTTGRTEAMSLSNTGVSGNSTSLRPVLSASGRWVAYHSIASNLVPGDDNNAADVFARDRETGRTMLVSATADGTPANGRSERAQISADGRYVVFQSSATDIQPGVTGTHIYLRDLKNGTTTLVSKDSNGTPADRGGETPDISADGRRIVFRTWSQLDSTAGSGYLYLHHTGTDRTSLVPGSGSLQASDPTISGNGEYVAYDTTHRVFVVDVSSGQQKDFATPGRVVASRLNHTGRYLAFFQERTRNSSEYDTFLWDRVTEGLTDMMVTPDGDPIAEGVRGAGVWGAPGISDNGRIVGFWTKDLFHPADGDGLSDVFLRDRGDVVAPRVHSTRISPGSPKPDEPFEFRATADDSRRGSAPIGSAQYRVDSEDWQDMSALDGTFDSPREELTAQVPGVAGGRHEICARAADLAGNVSPMECRELDTATVDTPVAVTGLDAMTTDSLTMPDPQPYVRIEVTPGVGPQPGPDDFEYDSKDDPAIPKNLEQTGAMFANHGETVGSPDGRARVQIEAGFGPGSGATRLRLPLDLSGSDNDDDQRLQLMVNLTTGQWESADGSIATPVACAETPNSVDSGTLRGRFCFAISTMSTSGDLDEDGLLDHWERFGLNTDTDTEVEVKLPSFGATPDHKDLFVEYDVEDDAFFGKTQEDGLRQVIQAFSVAPIDAGGTVPNPDGTPGIRLHIDSPSSAPDLSLGGGEVVSTPEICGVKGAFYDVKADEFDQDRRWAFRYAMKESADSDCAPGGQGEIGGNDFVVFNHDWYGKTFMHELGHNLNLSHGGNEHTNFKPNYLSIMNYRYGFTLRRTDGNRVLDFSPVRRIDGTRPDDLLPDIDEEKPPQGEILAPDRDTVMIYIDERCDLANVGVADAFDIWATEPGPDEPIAYDYLNIKKGRVSTRIGGDEYSYPDACADPGKDYQVLTDHDDWGNLSLPFRQFGDAADGPINPAPDEDYPTDPEIKQIQQEANTADLAVEVTGPNEPIRVGELGEVLVRLRNLGALAAMEPQVSWQADRLRVEPRSDGCDADTCQLAPLFPGETAELRLRVTGQDVGQYRFEATSVNLLAPDLRPADNAAGATIEVESDEPGPTPTPTPTDDPTSGPTPEPTGSDEPSAGPTVTSGPNPPVETDPPRQPETPSKNDAPESSGSGSTDATGSRPDNTAESAGQSHDGVSQTGSAVVRVLLAAGLLFVLVGIGSRRIGRHRSESG